MYHNQKQIIMTEYYIKPIRSYTDEDGTWWIELNKKDVKELFEKYNNK